MKKITPLRMTNPLALRNTVKYYAWYVLSMLAHVSKSQENLSV